MTLDNFITEERNDVPDEELVTLLTETLAMLKRGEDPSVIFMRATPSESEEYSAIELCVRSPDQRLLRGMLDMLTEWEARNLPPDMTEEPVGSRN